MCCSYRARGLVGLFDWKEGKQHGNGNFTFGGNGCTFEGEFVNGEVQEADLARWEAAKNHL